MGRRKKITPFTAEMEILDAATDGRSVARHNEEVIFIEKGVPGDLAEVYVYRKEKRLPIGRVEKVIRPSQYRTEPQCQHFGLCGGCKWQHMSYEGQLVFKEKQVRDALQRIGKVEPQEFLPILGCETEYYYRNKLEFTFSEPGWIPREQLDNEEEIDRRMLGFHVPRMFDKVFDVNSCHLQTEMVSDILNELRTFVRDQDFSFYNIRENTGYLRNIVFRTSVHNDGLMVILIVNGDSPEPIDRIFSHLEAVFPQITEFIWINNPKQNSSFSELPFTVWKGNPYITERLGNFDFRIRPTSFFQTNPRQAERLYEVVRNFMAECLPEGENKFQTVYDLYSGTGSIGIFISGLAEKVVGIEYVESAVEDARENVRINQPETAFSFYAGDMKDLLSDDLVATEGRPDMIIADPPRQGMAPQVVEKILALAPEHIVYVSCKPATQARDIQMMAEAYDLVRVRPVDMFPQTAHVENVALLRRK